MCCHYPLRRSCVYIIHHTYSPISTVYKNMWSLVYINIQDEEETPDLVPNTWIKSQNECWYPVDYKMSKIKSLAKTVSLVNKKEWILCPIKIIEKDIANYESGLRMMVKLAKKGELANLYSETEARGRGQREKKKVYLSSDSDEDKKPLKRHKNCFNETPKCPTFPTTDNSNRSELLFEEQNPKTSIGSPSIPPKMNVLSPKCKLSTKKTHSCSFSHFKKGEDTMNLVLHQLCTISADIHKIKSNVSHLKKELYDFIEQKSISVNKIQDLPVDDDDSSIGSLFPYHTEEDINTVEQKINAENKEFSKQLLSYIMFASEGKDEVRALTSILRLLFSDELAVKYSWKGQKGKNSLHNLNIFNIIIKAIVKKFPNKVVQRTTIINGIMSWFSQASQRLKNSENKMNKTREDSNSIVLEDF